MEGIRRSIGADSLGHVSLDNLVAASEQPASRLCTACFNGRYPIPLPPNASVGKHLLEELDGVERGIAGDAAPVLPVGAGAEDALRRP